MGKLGVSVEGIRRFLERIGENHAHGVVVLRHGEKVVEGYWRPYRREYNHVLYSLSKSFTSTAIGFAVQEGLLKVTDEVFPFFEEDFGGGPCENMRLLTVKDLLTMATGHRREPNILLEADWVKAFLTSYIERTPGVETADKDLFVYNSTASFMLSAVLQKVAGKTCMEYLEERLFGPLGISDIWYEEGTGGINAGGWGLNMKTADIAKFGQFLLQKGMWEGVQLLDPAWIEEATVKHIETVNHGGRSEDWLSGYGYQFWMCSVEGVYRGDGMHGQYCVVLPQYDMVVAMNAGTAHMEENLKAIWQCLLPGIDEEQEEEPGAWKALEQYLEELEIPVEKGIAVNKDFPAQAAYRLSPNALKIEEMNFVFGEEKDEIELKVNGDVLKVNSGHGVWIDNETDYKEPLNCLASRFFSQVSASSGWRGGKYYLKLFYNHTPYVDTLEVEFFAGAVEISFTRYPNHPVYGTVHQIIGRKI